jgi:hypothetical protein
MLYDSEHLHLKAATLVWPQPVARLHVLSDAYLSCVQAKADGYIQHQPPTATPATAL